MHQQRQQKYIQFQFFLNLIISVYNFNKNIYCCMNPKIQQFPSFTPHHPSPLLRAYSLQQNTSSQSQKNADDPPMKKEPTSLQLMNNLNSSFNGLFSRIKQIKDGHSSHQQKNYENFDRFPKLQFKMPTQSKKTTIKPFTMKHIPTNQQIKKEQPEKNFLKSNRKIEEGGLLSIPSLKVSMEITDDHLNSSTDYTSQKFNNSSTLTVDSLKISDFQLGKCVGSGKFGDVFLCIHKRTQTIYALKKIFKSTIQEYSMIEQFTRQLRIHYELDHPNIIKLYTHFDDEYHIFLLMEYAEGGILLDKLKSTQQYTSRIVQQAIYAVQYLHEKKIAHRDIKPQNIVLQFDSVAKLCDFGWSSFYHNEMKKTFCGTLDYVSPEMKDKGQYDSSVDIWSLGVLTYELLLGESPLKKQLSNWRNKGFKKGQKTNWNIIYPPTISTAAESFLRNLLKENPDDRGSLRFCLNHFFIRKYRQIEKYQQLRRIF